ncbi:hypothetical protein GEV33_006711 [Tenebrio molitor]|uniref:Uncharacterized protein n=1 Tax=Tenebrio molitor TaxID=7067 RepID=A0A8J6LD00_TENMO|nr:hypothetical protein GEV33_006711 [Tenebrio molitor]
MSFLSYDFLEKYATHNSQCAQVNDCVQIKSKLITTYTTQLIRQQCVQLNFF